MAGRVDMVDGVADAIQVGIDPARTEGAERVGAVEAAQVRVVGPVAFAQQVPAMVVFAYFSVETQCAVHGGVAVVLTIGAVHGRAQGVALAFGQQAVLGIGQEQQRLGVVANGLLTHRLVVAVEVIDARITLSGTAQAIILVEAQGFAVGAVFDPSQLVVTVVAITAYDATGHFIDTHQAPLCVVAQIMTPLIGFQMAVAVIMQIDTLRKLLEIIGVSVGDFHQLAWIGRCELTHGFIRTAILERAPGVGNVIQRIESEVLLDDCIAIPIPGQGLPGTLIALKASPGIIGEGFQKQGSAVFEQMAGSQFIVGAIGLKQRACGMPPQSQGALGLPTLLVVLPLSQQDATGAKVFVAGRLQLPQAVVIEGGLQLSLAHALNATLQVIGIGGD
ncbi:hypothetical protein D3C85_982090 [compost metagenome]